MYYLDSQGRSASASRVTASNRSLMEIAALEDWFLPLKHDEAAGIRGGIASPEERPTLTPIPQTTSVNQPASNSAAEVYPWSESLQTVLNHPPATLPTRLILAGLAFSGLFMVWAWFSRIQEVSYAQGQLVPQGEVYKIQPPEQAEIAKILIKEGQSIKKGQEIARLDNRLAQAEVERLEKASNNYQLQLIQTQGLIDRTRLEAQTREAIAQANAQAQQAVIIQAKTDEATNRALLLQLEDQMTAYQQRLKRLQPLVEEGALAQDRLFEVQESLRERQQTVTQTTGKLQSALAQVAEMQAGLAQKQAEGKKSSLELQQRLQELELQAAELKAKMAETETLLKTAQTKFAQTFLYSPVDGTVSSLNVDHQGEVAQAGQTIAEIAPAKAPLVLSAVLPNREAGFVKEGMRVQMKFDAFPYQDYGIVPGKVISISPDAKPDKEAGTAYRVKVALDQSNIAGQPIRFKAGQTATAEIVARQRRVIDILLEPIRQLQKGGISL